MGGPLTRYQDGAAYPMLTFSFRHGGHDRCCQSSFPPNALYRHLPIRYLLPTRDPLASWISDLARCDVTLDPSSPCLARPSASRLQYLHLLHLLHPTDSNAPMISRHVICSLFNSTFPFPDRRCNSCPWTEDIFIGPPSAQQSGM